MESDGWVYSEKEHWPKTCKHKRYSEDKFFECVLSDCGIPDQKGIDLNTTRREDAIGIHRRIHASCSDGYSQSGSGRLICQSNGEWKYDIVCEDITKWHKVARAFVFILLISMHSKRSEEWAALQYQETSWHSEKHPETSAISKNYKMFATRRLQLTMQVS
uniref:Sushi domain-containing protein n=1 Tax=Magallana gigas TaxID=29159 RepID=A0A8W8MM90_MAGGI